MFTASRGSTACAPARDPTPETAPGPVTATAPIAVSFEFFPPRNPTASDQLWDTMRRLAPLNPRFVSVTYGAAGSTREATREVVRHVLAATGLAPAPHLTCVGATRAELLELVDEYRAMGVRHLVALRGDAPAGQPYRPHPDGFASTAELVAAIMRSAEFDVSVAAYPEMHPEARSAADDLDNLRRKIDAGAKRAITQFFFDADVFLRFRDACVATGIVAPLVPGILPIVDFQQLTMFAKRCGTTIPRRVAARFDGLDEDPVTQQLISASLAIELVARLRAEGVTEFHIYTLNRGDLAYAVCHTLGLRPGRAVAPPQPRSRR